MSHFTVLVVGKEFGEEEVEKLLNPYWELDLSYEDMKKDSRAEFKIEIPDGYEEEFYEKWKIKKEQDLEKIGKDHKKILKKVCGSNNIVINDTEILKFIQKYRSLKEWHQPIIKEKAIEILITNSPIPSYYKNSYANAKEWINDWHYYIYEKGKGWGYYHNPNAKWDWYLIGGRWTGFFKSKDTSAETIGAPGVMTKQAKIGYTDQIRKCDIDIEGTIRTKIKNTISNWKEGKEKYKDNPEYQDILYGIKEGDTKESYVERKCKVPFSTYAIVLDGKWIGKGDMGWWGISTNEQNDWEDVFLKIWRSIPEDAVLTLVDCHI